MFSLKSRKDAFKFAFPKEFISDELNEKYKKILEDKHSFITSPLDFLNETITRVSIMGVTEGVVQQMQQGRSDGDNMPYSASEVYYRSPVSPLKLIDKTLSVEFRHTLGYINYFLMMEIFWDTYEREYSYDDLMMQFSLEIVDNTGQIISKCLLSNPLIQAIDCLNFDYTKPIAQSETFKVVFRYSNFDCQYISNDDN